MEQLFHISSVPHGNASVSLQLPRPCSSCAFLPGDMETLLLGPREVRGANWGARAGPALTGVGGGSTTACLATLLESHPQPRLPSGLMCSGCSGDVWEAWDDTDSLGQLKLFPAFPQWHSGIWLFMSYKHLPRVETFTAMNFAEPSKA